MKAKRIISVMVALAISLSLLTVTASSTSFPDVDDYAEYAEVVEYLSDMGLMVGDENGNFNPNKTVTRAEMATIICRMMGETENLTTSNDFTDVPAKHWANAYIAKAVELGIVTGYGDGKYGPSDAVTFEQAVAMVVRAAGWDEDVDAFGGYPDGYLSIAEGYQLIGGITAKKGESLSRSHIAMILFNYYNPPFLFN